MSNNKPISEVILNHLFPELNEFKDFEKALNNIGFRIDKDENGTVWLEHDEYGFCSVEFLKAILMTSKI